MLKVVIFRKFSRHPKLSCIKLVYRFLRVILKDIQYNKIVYRFLQCFQVRDGELVFFKKILSPNPTMF